MTSHRAIAAAAFSLAVPLSLATELYHPSNAEEGATLRADHMKSSVSREQIYQGLLAAQRDGTLPWISRGYPATYPLVRGPALSNTREQVLMDLQQWKRNPVTSTGMTLLPGELGWVDAREAR